MFCPLLSRGIFNPSHLPYSQRLPRVGPPAWWSKFSPRRVCSPLFLPWILKHTSQHSSRPHRTTAHHHPSLCSNVFPTSTHDRRDLPSQCGVAMCICNLKQALISEPSRGKARLTMPSFGDRRASLGSGAEAAEQRAIFVVPGHAKVPSGYLTVPEVSRLAG